METLLSKIDMRVCNSITNCKNRGFSIVELVVCVALLSIAAIPVIKAFTMASKTNAKAQSLQNATSVAEMCMEEMKHITFAQMENKISSSVDYDKDASNWNVDNYTVLMKNVTSTGGEKFYVEASASIADYSMNGETNAANANVIELPILKKINRADNVAVSTEINKYDNSVKDVFKGLLLDKRASIVGWNPPSDDLEINNSATKMLTVKIKLNGSVYDVDVIIKYTGDARFVGESTYESVSFEREIYKGSFDSKPKVYLFYMTMWEYRDKVSTVVPFGNETIKIEDSSGAVKQYYLLLNDRYSLSGTDKYVYSQTPGIVKSTISLEGFPVDDGGLPAIPQPVAFIDGSQVLYGKEAGKYIYKITVDVYTDETKANKLTSMISTKDY